jgi:hypothetical protein
LEPIFEADFLPVSYGFRPQRRAHDAVADIHRLGRGQLLRRRRISRILFPGVAPEPDVRREVAPFGGVLSQGRRLRAC